MTGKVDPVADLLEYSVKEKVKPGIPCPVCLLPEREIIDAARRRQSGVKKGKKIGGVMVRRWLIERYGYTEKSAPDKQAIDRHFHRGHHTEEA